MAEAKRDPVSGRAMPEGAKAKEKELTEEEQAAKTEKEDTKARLDARKKQEKDHMEFLATVFTAKPANIDKCYWATAERQVILPGGTTLVRFEDGKLVCVRRPKYAAGEVLGKAVAKVLGVRTTRDRAVHPGTPEYAEIEEMTARVQCFVDDTPMLWEQFISELLECSPDGIPTEVARPLVDKFEYTEPTRCTADLKTSKKEKGTVFVEEFLPGAGFHMLCGEMEKEVLKDLGKWGALTLIFQQKNMFPLPVWKESGSLNNLMRLMADPKMMIALELAPMPLAKADLKDYEARLVQLVREELGLGGDIKKQEWTGYKVNKDQAKKELAGILDAGGWSCSAKDMAIVMEGLHEGFKTIASTFENSEIERALELGLEDCAKILPFDGTTHGPKACADMVRVTVKAVAFAQGKKAPADKEPDWMAKAQGIGKKKGPAAPQEPPKGALVYMTHTEDNLNLQFAKNNDGIIDGTLAYFVPKGKIPDFKYAQGGGKSIMFKAANLAAGKKNYLNGFCNFCKNGKGFQGEITVVSTEVVLYFLEASKKPSQKVIPVAVHTPVSLENIDAVVVVVAGNDTFKGVKEIDKKDFLSKGATQGASLQL